MKSKGIYLKSFLAAFILFTCVRCFDVPEEVLIPTWDVTLNIPLATDTVYMHEILKADEHDNLDIVDSPDIGDSIYFIVADEIESVTGIQNKLKLPLPFSPGSLPLVGNTGGEQLVAATIYNPDPEYHIRSAEFISGEIIIELENNAFSEAEYEIALPGFKDRTTMEIFSVNANIPALSKDTISVSLADLIYSELNVTGSNDLENYTTQESEGFCIIGKATPIGSSNLSLDAKIKSSEIILSKIVGRIKRTELSYFEESFSLDFGDNLEDFRNNIDFRDIKLTVEAQTIGELENIKIILDSMTVKGFIDGASVGSNLQFNNSDFYRDSLIVGVPFKREFNKDNTNINDFLSTIPNEIIFGNKLVIAENENADIDNQVVSNEDSLKFTAKISAPLHVAISGVEYTDTLATDFTQDDKDNIADAQRASITIDVENMISLGATATVVFLDENYNEKFVLKDEYNNSAFSITGASLSASGLPVNSSDNQITVELSQDEITDLIDSEYILVTFLVNTTGSTSTSFGPYARIRAKDFLKYKIYGSVDYRVDLEDEE